MAKIPVMRAHGGRRSAAIRPGTGVTISPDDLAGAIRDERARLGAGLSDGAYIRDLQRHGLAGRAAAEHLQQMLDAYRATARPQADSHGTPPVETASSYERGPRDTAFQWYPDGPAGSGVLPGHVAGLRPANTSAAAPFRAQAGRVR
ncbi:hypothetical protein [Catenuloplanes japonicus]|uniref:hypothetical protein n=1 Tax=Catenuloplanes japonicus TaxID=33876 RepID=UPI0018DD3817|nr:hypothetical protein [Catenuloplanes japonicus]